MADTLNRMFHKSVRDFSSFSALKSRVGGEYKAISYKEMGAKVRTFACGMLSLNVQKGDRVALISENRPEWAIIDIGLLQIGAINVAVFPTLPASQVQYILSDSGAKVLIVSDKKQLAKALEVKRSLKDLKIITIESITGNGKDILIFDEVLRRGKDIPLSDSEYEELWSSIKPDDTASIIYTSGTTGEPKGTILSHNNFASNVIAAQDVLTFKPGDVLLSFLPLNHVYGRLGDHYLPLSCGATIAYFESLRRLRQDMIDVKPHYMILVPRIFEMIHERLLNNVGNKPKIKQKLFHWAFSVGKRHSELIQNRRNISQLLALKIKLADKIVFSKIREQLGLGRLKLFVSGSAPLPKATAEFFFSMGLKILEGYGLTETSPMISVNRSHLIRFGTVGLPVKGVEVKIASDGEILVRGSNVMQGYHNKPQKTAEAIDSEGWFHTGDMGEIDEDGFLRITDRKKDIIVLANGKNVAPQPIENMLKDSHLISQVVLIGDRRNTISALIVPSYDILEMWVKEHGIKVNSEDKKEISRNPEVNKLIRSEIQRLSGNLAEFERIRAFTLIDHEFTVENGEITPTLKVKRNVILEKYKDVIEAMYG
jgi:long-chain acyl-CoA synthetase